MKLSPEWRKILRKAHSVRWMALAGVLTGLEAIISVVGIDWLPVPLWARLTLIMLVMGGAFASRLVAQKGYSNE